MFRQAVSLHSRTSHNEASSAPLLSRGNETHHPHIAAYNVFSPMSVLLSRLSAGKHFPLKRRQETKHGLTSPCQRRVLFLRSRYIWNVSEGGWEAGETPETSRLCHYSVGLMAETMTCIPWAFNELGRFPSSSGSDAQGDRDTVHPSAAIASLSFFSASSFSWYGFRGE